MQVLITLTFERGLCTVRCELTLDSQCSFFHVGHTVIRSIFQFAPQCIRRLMRFTSTCCS